ncbi:MAG TPA: dTMP kinase [Acidimicrobiia bacterium]|nr:dTMP kinase [Acidimicrobiia bacterium]
MSGFYLAIEGGEGAGKTTVVSLLERSLQRSGETVVTVREPGSTALGVEIRRLLLHWENMTPWAEAMLYAAQRAQVVAEVVAPALAAGAFVLSDRSLFSSLAYQGGARGLGFGPVRTVNEFAVTGILPQLVVVLVVDPATGLSRQADRDRIGGESAAFHQMVDVAYRELARLEPERVKLVEVTPGPDRVAGRILDLIESARG